jgi:hypothetical protein
VKISVDEWFPLAAILSTIMSRHSQHARGGPATAEARRRVEGQSKHLLYKINDGHYLGSSITISMALLGQIV